ncbi:MAG: ice-binding family protein [Bacteroidota bacterium]
MKNANVQTITRSAIRPAIIMSISLAMFLFAACESNSPSTQQDISGPSSAARTINESAVPFDVVSNLAVQEPVNLGLADGFAILSYAGITNTGNTSITGNLGASPITGAALTGFETVALVGTFYTVDATGPAGSVISASMLDQAMLDVTAAYNDAAGRTENPISVEGNLGGQTLLPGLYKSTGALEISSGDLTLDAQGDVNAVWIFQIASSFNMTSGRQVFLTGGAKASNIFWQVGSSATFGTTAVMKGTILAYATVTLATGASLEGRALARTANVTLDANTIVKP